MNPYEAAARAKKVQAICAAVDVVFGRMSIDTTSGYAATLIAAMGDQEWFHVAEYAQVNIPSADTRIEVLQVYLDRDAARERLEQQMAEEFAQSLAVSKEEKDAIRAARRTMWPAGSEVARLQADMDAEEYKAGRDARVAKKMGLTLVRK